MKDKLIQLIVAVLAVAALAAVVYRAQQDAPPPPTPGELTISNEPEFLPSTKTDAGEGVRPRLPPAPGERTEKGASDADEVVEKPTLSIDRSPQFLPTTKSGPVLMEPPGGEDTGDLGDLEDLGDLAE